MKLPETGILLRIFIGESDSYKGQTLFEAIVIKARELQLAGATVIRGIMGFGASKLLTLSEDLPIIIEIVDTEDKIDQLMPFLDEVVKEGLITKERVNIIKYLHRKRLPDHE
jgi:PII-like signaling protein